MISSVSTFHRHNMEGNALGSPGSPIDKIPDELLALVFALYDNRYPLSDHVPTPHILSGVDRRWRRVAINLTTLWNHIVLSFLKFWSSPSTYLERPSLWIERSRASPLDISIDLGRKSYMSDSSEESLLNLVLPQVARWRSFHAHAYYPADLANWLTALKVIELPLLQEVAVITQCKMMIMVAEAQEDINHGHRAFLHGVSPSLRSVRLVGMCHFSTIPLHNLTSLDLRNQTNRMCRPSYEDVRELIAGSPALKHLTLHSLDFSFPRDADLAPLTMPCLETLSINFRLPGATVATTHSLLHFLSLLTAPALAEMELICMNPFQIQGLLDLMSKRSPHPVYANLHTFKLALSSFSDDNIEKLFHFFCPSTTTFFSIRNRGSTVVPAKTNVFVLSPNGSYLSLEYPKEKLQDSSLKVIRVLNREHIKCDAERWANFSSKIKIEIVDNPALFKYTGEDDSDQIVTRVEDEDDDRYAWDYEENWGLGGYGSDSDSEDGYGW